MKRKRLFALLTIMVLIGGGGVANYAFKAAQETGGEMVLGHGNLDALKGIYSQWRENYEARGGNATTLRLSLAHSKALSTTDSKARGSMELNLMTGLVSVKVKGLDKQSYDVWLVDNREGVNRTVKPEAGDGFFRLGTLTHKNDYAELATKIDRTALADFKVDMVTVTPAGQSPDQGIVLTGSPDLMLSLYYSDKLWAMAKVGDLKSRPQAETPFGFLLPKLAQADANQDNLTAVLGAQIAEGRRIFINETFGGNGRTCSTCHRLDNNHTIDPKYIAKLPKNDPLFVAENPDSPLHDAGFENPKLMRELGLILANVDGFDKPGVMRSVPHTLGLSKTITTELPPSKGGKGEFELDYAFANALGWSGDGSSDGPTGSLREFALGAVKQHFTRSMGRNQGADFRFPSDTELDALQAYMLALGRSEDINLSKMTFKSNIVQRGKVLFDVKNNPVVNGKPVLGTSANCNGCHSNAGAISSTTGANPTRDTGVEFMKDQPAVLLDPTVPRDGGIGDKEYNPSNAERGWCTDGDPETPCSYGEQRFNTPSLIEAADTAPFFHNNSVSTLEEAVAFYNTPEFNNSPGHLTSSLADRTVQISSSQVIAVALFLRSINALENIRSSNKLDDQAKLLNAANGKEITKLAMADTEDAIEVLTEGKLLPFPEAVNKLQTAYNLEYSASLVQIPALRNPLLTKAKALKLEADALIVSRAP
jgi:hypothetical protein